MYRDLRQKHPFLAPPASKTLDPSMNELLQDTLRGSKFASLPFYDQTKVIAILDKLSSLPANALPALDTILMEMLSASMLQELFGL